MKLANPVIFSDFPDPDVIRVGGWYYMASTTMFYMPGGDILRSKDLLRWEFAGHIFDRLGDLPSDRLENGENIFGQGMWAPSLRFHNGRFHVVFSCNNTHSTLIFTSDSPEGRWERQTMGGFFYDPSLFFDDDGRTYIVHGNTVLHLTELDEGWCPKKGGLDRVIVRDREGQPLGYEGSHLYKHDGRYYLFTCHMPAGERVIKTEDCFIADSLEGEFRGKEIIREDFGHRGLGVAQGGMVDTPDGKWYLFMFQDRGALGRSPVLLPMEFDSEGYPVPLRENGVIPMTVENAEKADREPSPLTSSLFCDESGKMLPCWQFSHVPDAENYSFPAADRFVIRTGALSDSLTTARNTLTQRCFGKKSSASVLLDGGGLNDGDCAGLCIYISAYSAIALTKDENGFSLVLLNSPADDETFFGMKDFTKREPKVLQRLPLSAGRVYLRAEADFAEMPDTVRFCYSLTGGEWLPFGEKLPIYFKMDMFTGSRFGLFMYSTKAAGGSAEFSDHHYTVI